MATKEELARQMAHTYQGGANDLGPVAKGLQGYLSKFGPGYWEGVKGDIDTGMRNQLARSIMAVAQQSPEVQNKLGISPTQGDSRNAIADYMAALPMNTESLAGPMGAFAGMIAYHGSPHKFDKFKLDKIGTGEGAQAYGHGLYFAENPNVAKSYADVNSTSSLYIGKKKIDVDALPDIEKAATKSIAAQGYENAIKATKEMRDNGADPKWMDAYETALRKYEKSQPRWVADNANLYKVDISDDAVKNFLDWDKPLSQQPESVRKVLSTVIGVGEDPLLGIKAGGSVGLAGGGRLKAYADHDFGTKFFLENDGKEFRLTEADARNLIGSGVEGKSIYNLFVSMFGQDGASAKLKELGIPGIRYLDQGSREAGKGSSNFVVFDEDIVKVLERK